MIKAFLLGVRMIAFAVLTVLALLALPGHTEGLPEARTAFNQRSTFAEPQGGASVSFKSPGDGGDGLDIKGLLFKPAGEANGAVVIVNSGSGWSDAREGHYARSISSAGYAVLAIDSLGARGIASTATDNSTVSTYGETRDAFAAKKYLVSLGYPADRIAVMGVGRGGTIALLAADRTFVQGGKEDPFSVSIAVSAVCVLHPREPKPSARVFMAIGDKDEVTGVKPCQDLAKEYNAAGGKTTVKVYPGATTGFDGDPMKRIMVRNPMLETFVDCDVVVGPDGSFVYGGKTFAGTESASVFAAMRKSCSSTGASTYTNVTQKANVTLDLIDFLDANFLH